MPSHLRADLDRYNEAGHRSGSLAFWRHIARQAYTHPGLLAVLVYRYGQWCRTVPMPSRILFDIAYHALYTLVRFALQIEMPREFTAGPGLRVDHYGGILVTSGAIVGRNFTLTQGVLLGATETGTPTIGDDVHCGVGVKIIGGITLGDCLKIGTASVVTKSFPGHAVIAGIPARELRPLDVAPRADGWIPRKPNHEDAKGHEDTEVALRRDQGVAAEKLLPDARPRSGPISEGLPPELPPGGRGLAR